MRGLSFSVNGYPLQLFVCLKKKVGAEVETHALRDHNMYEYVISDGKPQRIKKTTCRSPTWLHYSHFPSVPTSCESLKAKEQKSTLAFHLALDA
ncbi:hypothetical protein VNO77_42446 [Canavalia gladiata]|uniref:Uncharacterized protein n=1 Tax=Canavalia gladiata TaxID=3824 RepID=A0AAN9PM07_CANGL